MPAHRQPNCGEIWQIPMLVNLSGCNEQLREPRPKNRTVFVLEFVDRYESKAITVADSVTGEIFAAPIEKMEFVEDVCLHTIAEFCQNWARNGNANACWWLGWYYKGTCHQKSVWYEIAAMRQNPVQHGWAISRVYSDAMNPRMCAGFERPVLRFLNEISEFQQYFASEKVAVWGDYQEAIENARNFIFLPDGDTPISIESVQ